MGTAALAQELKVADEVWIAAALLHREHPDRGDFTAKEIADRAEQENITGALRKGVYVHALLHCVANLPPNPGRYRMLYETTKGRRRLFRPGDRYDSRREGGKSIPERTAIPERYRELLDWYREWAGEPSGEDPLLGLAGSGRAVWAKEHADDYVRRLREGWE
jgi:hypothetical protein